MEERIQTHKPFILKITSIIALTYHAVFLSIFLSGIIFNHFFTIALENYFPNEIGHHAILYFSIFGTILNTISIIGLIYIRKLKVIGLLLYSGSVLVFFIFKFIFWDISYINLIINSLFISIFTFHLRHYD